MSWSAVQSQTANTTANDGGNAGAKVTPAWGSPTTANNLLLAVLTYDVTSTVTPPSGWVELTGSPWNNASAFVRVYAIAGAASRSGTETFTFGTNQTVANAALIEYSGGATSSAQDGSANTNTATSATPTGSAFTTSGAGEAVVSVVSQSSAGTASATFSAPTGGSAIRCQSGAADVGPNGNNNLCVLDELNVAAGTYTFGCTSSRNEGWIVVTLAFKGANPGVAYRTAHVIREPHDNWPYEE